MGVGEVAEEASFAQGNQADLKMAQLIQRHDATTCDQVKGPPEVPMQGAYELERSGALSWERGTRPQGVL